MYPESVLLNTADREILRMIHFHSIFLFSSLPSLMLDSSCHKYTVLYEIHSPHQSDNHHLISLYFSDMTHVLDSLFFLIIKNNENKKFRSHSIIYNSYIHKWVFD